MFIPSLVSPRSQSPGLCPSAPFHPPTRIFCLFLLLMAFFGRKLDLRHKCITSFCPEKTRVLQIKKPDVTPKGSSRTKKNLILLPTQSPVLAPRLWFSCFMLSPQQSSVGRRAVARSVSGGSRCFVYLWGLLVESTRVPG